MRRVKFAAVAAAAVLLFAAFSGCQSVDVAGGLGEKIGDSVKDAVEDVKDQAADDIKSAVMGEIRDYLTDSEIAKSLGISPEDQEEILESIRGYIDNYKFDAAQLDKIKTSFDELIKNAKELSAEEIKKGIEEIIRKQ